MLRRFKLPIVVIAIVILNQAAGYAVQAAVPSVVFPSGTTRYAVVSATDNILVTDTLWHAVSGLSTTLNIPAGKTGDAIILFCAEAYSPSDSALFARAMVGTSAATPPEFIIAEQPVIESHCATFYKTGLAAGNRTFKMQWRASNTYADLYDRTMTVILNIH